MVARRKHAADRADARRAKKYGSPGMARRPHRRAPLCPNLKRIVQEVWAGGKWLFSAGGAWLRRVFAALRRQFSRRPARAAATTTPSSSSPRGGPLRVDADLSSSPPGGPRRDEIGGSSLPAGRAPNRAPPAGPHGNSAPPSGCASHAAPPAGRPLAHTGRPSIDAARAQPPPRNTAERVVATTAPHGGGGEGGGSKRRRVARPDADEGPPVKQVGGQPSDHRASRRQEDGEGSYALDGDIYGAADIDTPHSSNAAPPVGILSCTAPGQLRAPGAQHHALVFEEAPSAALSPYASVHPAVTCSDLPIPPPTAGSPSAADRARREPPAGGGNRDGTDAVAAAWANAYTDGPTPNQAGLVHGLPPGAEGVGRRATPTAVAMEHGGVLAVGEPLVGGAPNGELGTGLQSNTAKKGTVLKRAARTNKKPAPAKNNGVTHQLIGDEDYVEEEVDLEHEAHRNYVKKIAAWRKGFTLCLICHLKGEEKEITADNEMIKGHCSRAHQGNGFKCKKQGCLARGKTMHDIGLHEIECLRTRQRKC